VQRVRPGSARELAGGDDRRPHLPDELFKLSRQVHGGAGVGEVETAAGFRAVGDETEMTSRHLWFDSKEARDNHDHGWSGSFDKLAEVLADAPGQV